MFRRWLAVRVVAATLREAARSIETVADNFNEPWARDLANQLRVLASELHNFRR